MKDIQKHIILLFIFALATISFKAQNNFSSQEELKKEADRLFYEKQYDKCLPLFSQLLSNYPKDPNYNYKFGASQLFAESDKEKPLRYLKFAASKPNVNPEAYYFLGRAYHLNYEFDAAITYYNKFKNKADKKQLEKFPVDLLIQQCKNGKTLLSDIKKINVLEKKEVKRSDFFRSYKLEGIDGKIIVKPDEFKSKYDLKVKENSIIYFPSNAREVYYSSYGKDGSTGKDIYRVVKLPNNEWSKPQRLSDAINSPYDEDYPFMHPDGKTLYFCSKGHNSMGGYDIFKSEYDPVLGEWSKPVNLDFAISSADDDILFISDIDNKFAYFASNRESGIGYVNVYKVTVESKKEDMYAMIKGRVVNEANPSKSFAKITIIDPATNKTIGIQHTDENGEYIIVLPKPDKEYKFLVETTENSPIHSATIKVPPVEKDMAVKQELIFSGQGDAQKMVVKNMFDETVTLTPSDPLYVEHVIKRTAKLDVNTSEEELSSRETASNEQETSESPAASVSKEEALTRTEEILNALTETYEKAQKEANAAFEYAKNKSKEAQNRLKEVNDLREKLTDESLSESEKSSTRNEINKKEFEAALAANEANTAYALALGLESDAQAKKQDVQQMENLLNSIENANDDNEIAQIYQSVQETAQNNTESSLSSDIELKRLSEKYESSKEKYNKQEQYVRELKNNRSDIEKQIADLQKQRDNSKKKKEYEALDSQIAALKIDLDDIQFDIENAETKLKTLKEQYAIDEQAYLSGKEIVNYIKSTDANTVITDDAKKQLAYNIGAFEQENLLAHYPVKENTQQNEAQPPASTSTSEEITYEDLKNQYDIIDENGNLVNYSAEYSNQLAETDNITDPFQKNLQIAKINQDWINDINQEIKIKQQIAETTQDVSKKLKLEDEIASLQELKKQKQQETEQLLAQSEQNNETVNNTSENTSQADNEEKFPQIVKVEPVEIENENGEIIDFVTPIEEELQAAESIENEKERNLAKAKAYQKWANATNEVLTLKKLDLAQADEADKVFIESEINTLEQIAQEKYNLAKQYYEAAEGEEALAKQSDTQKETNETQEVFSEVSSTENIPENITQAGILDDKGELIDYSSNFKEELTQYEDNPEKQNEIRKEWNNKLEAEIAYQEWKLQNTDDLNEKINIKNQINKLEQQIELNNIEIANAEESLALLTESQNTENVENTNARTESSENETSTETSSNESTENIAENEELTTPTETAQETQSTNTSEETAQQTIEEQTENQKEIQETINQKPLDQYNYSDEDDFSDIKYNNNLTYQYPKAQTDLAKAKRLKQEAAALVEESNLLRAQMQQTQDKQLRKELLEQSDEKLRQSEEKQLQIAQLYGNANTDEYFNNQQILQNLNNDIKNDETSFAEVLTDEANYYFAEAEKLRQQAKKYPNFSSQANALQKAYEFELKAIDKQRKAIEIYKKSAPQQSAEIIASVQPAVTANEELANTNTENPSSEDNNLSANNLQEVTPRSETTQTPVLPENFNQFATTNPKAERLIKEAGILEQEAFDLQSQADFLRDSANTSIKKKKIKEAVFAQADKLEKQAVEKQTKAQELRQEAEQENEKLAALNQKLAENHRELSNTELSANEEQTLNNLSGEEIQNIVQSEEFNAFKEKKSTARRLVKEAEVEYIEAEKVKKEMESQNALIGAIKALASSSDEPGREEKAQEQIAEMQRRIEENSEKLQQLQKSAQEKEEKALALNQDAEEILTTLPQEKVLAFTALEKSEERGTVPTSEQLAENTSPNQNERNTLPQEEESNTSQEEISVNQNTEQNREESSTFNQPNETTEETTENETTTSQEQEELAVTENTTEQPEETSISTNENNSTNPSKNVNQPEETNFSPENTQPEETTETEELTAQNEAPEKTNEVTHPETTNSTTENISSVENKPIEQLAREPLPKQLNMPAYFKLSNSKVAAYNENNPIPRNPEMPEGLIFKVQVGAFRNPIPQNHFKGFAPIMAEDAGNGITRYTAGLFTDFNAAIFARDEIRSIGYPDAFVVAFYNGKRISIPEARKIMEQQGQSVAQTNTNVSTSNSNTTQQNSTENNLTEPTELSVNENAPSVDNGVSVDVQNIKGVFYTVQVGVYSKPVSEGPLLTIKPLNSEKTASGLIRYTSGRFTNLEDARKHKQKVNSLIPDAFITAYANGKRIPVEEAAKLLQQSAGQSQTNATGQTQQNTSETSNNNFENQENSSTENETNTNNFNQTTETNITVSPEENETTKPVDKLELINKADSLQLEFKVLLGKYTEEVPITDAAKLLKLSGKGVKHFEYNDATYYTIGSYPDYQSALDKQIEMRTSGFENAQVIAMKNGEIIPVEQALELIKE